MWICGHIVSDVSVDVFIGKGTAEEWQSELPQRNLQRSKSVCDPGAVSADSCFSMVLLTDSSDGRTHSWKGGGEAPFINSLFILNLLISCWFCSLTKKPWYCRFSSICSWREGKGEGTRGKREGERERGDMVSNSAETAIDCRERESVSDYLAAGMFSCSCVIGRGSSPAEPPSPRQVHNKSICHVCICVQGNVPANLLCVQQCFPVLKPLLYSTAVSLKQACLLSDRSRWKLKTFIYFGFEEQICGILQNMVKVSV